MYIAYKNIAARGLYGCGSLSPSYASLTRGYALSEISTLVSAPDYVRYGPHASNGPEQVLNPADLFSNCSSISYNPSSYNRHCYPSLVYPHGMQDVHPAWRGCTDALKGNHLAVPDPPRVLTPVGALGPTTTRENAQLGIMSASPASNLASPTVTKTDTPQILASDSRSAFDPQQPSSINMDQASILNVNTKTERLTAKESHVSVEHGSRSAIGSDTRDLPLDGTHESIMVEPQRLSDFSKHSDATQISHVDSFAFDQISKTPDARSVTPTIVSTFPSLDEGRGDSSFTEHLGPLGAQASKMLSAFRPLQPGLRDPSRHTRGTNHGFSSFQHINSLQSESANKVILPTITAPAEPFAVSFAVIDQGGLSLAGTAYRSGPVIIAESTLKAGPTALPIQGHRISIDPTASKLIVDGQTLLMPSLLAEAMSGIAASQAYPYVKSILGSVAQAASPHGTYIVNGQAITRGGESATISGTPIGFDADENLVIGTSILEGFQKPSFLEGHPILTAGGLTLTVGAAGQGEAYTRDAPAPTSQQATIGSHTHSAASRSGEVAPAESKFSDRVPATIDSGGASIFGSKENVAFTVAEPTSTSKPDDKVRGSAIESISAACSSCLTTPTSEMSQIIMPARVSLISIVMLSYSMLA